ALLESESVYDNIYIYIPSSIRQRRTLQPPRGAAWEPTCSNSIGIDRASAETHLRKCAFRARALRVVGQAIIVATETFEVVRENSHRKFSHRKISHRKFSHRKISHRKISRRKISYRKISHRKISHRKISYRKKSVNRLYQYSNRILPSSKEPLPAWRTGTTATIRPRNPFTSALRAKGGVPQLFRVYHERVRIP